jgi:hypothetical protein
LHGGCVGFRSVEACNQEGGPCAERESSTEDRLNGKDKSTQYDVIVGPKGCGKSVAIARLLKDRNYTIYVKVSSACTSPTALLALLSTMCEFPTGAEPSEEHLFEAFDSGQAKGEIPCIVFDVDCNQKSQVLGAVCKLAKAFLDHAVSLIVVSEANDVLAFGKDHQRETSFGWKTFLRRNAVSISRKPKL